jgi:hypothetical protein
MTTLEPNLMKILEIFCCIKNDQDFSQLKQRDINTKSQFIAEDSAYLHLPGADNWLDSEYKIGGKQN